MDACTVIRTSCVVLTLLSVATQVLSQVLTVPNIAVTDGQPAELPCSFNDTHLVAVSWRKGQSTSNATEVLRYFRGRVTQRLSDQYNLTSNYGLTIQMVNETDEGLYWCQVTMTGLFSNSTFLTVNEITTTTEKPVPTKAQLLEGPDKIPIIIGCAIGGLILLALIVLAVYCCCCKNREPAGYRSPKPV